MSSSTAGSTAQAQAKKVKIFINDVKFSVAHSKMTGSQLKELAGIAPANQLFLDVPGPHDDDQVFDDQPFKLRPGQRFYDVPVGNLGAR